MPPHRCYPSPSHHTQAAAAPLAPVADGVAAAPSLKKDSPSSADTWAPLDNICIFVGERAGREEREKRERGLVGG